MRPSPYPYLVLALLIVTLGVCNRPTLPSELAALLGLGEIFHERRAVADPPETAKLDDPLSFPSLPATAPPRSSRAATAATSPAVPSTSSDDVTTPLPAAMHRPSAYDYERQRTQSLAKELIQQRGVAQATAPSTRGREAVSPPVRGRPQEVPSPWTPPAHTARHAQSPASTVEEAAPGFATTDGLTTRRERTTHPSSPGNGLDALGPAPGFPVMSEPSGSAGSAGPPHHAGAPARAPAAHGPPTTVRPASQSASGFGNQRQSTPSGRQIQVELIPCAGATPLARVGTEVILASDVLPEVEMQLDAALEAQLAKMPPEQRAQVPPEEFETFRRMGREVLTKQLLQQRIDMKLLYYDLIRTMPPEALEKNKELMEKEFDRLAVPRKMKELGVDSRRALEETLQKRGVSLDRQRRHFIEMQMAASWMEQNLADIEPVRHDEMLEYYHEHSADYESTPRARWEQLSAEFSEYDTEHAAWQAITRMGNAVAQGQPFSQVARQMSDGATAHQGGAWDWTRRGTLRSQVIEDAIFSQPVGRLSPEILRDERGFHIIRVVQRDDGTRTPFSEVQDDIRQHLEETRKRKRRMEFLERLRREIPVWTAFDEPSATTATRPHGAGRGAGF